MDPNASIEREALAVIERFTMTAPCLCNRAEDFIRQQRGPSNKSEPDLGWLVELCDLCMQTVTAHTEATLVSFTPSQSKTEQSTSQGQVFLSIRKFLHWVADNPGIVIGTVTFSIGLAFFLAVRKDK